MRVVGVVVGVVAAVAVLAACVPLHIAPSPKLPPPSCTPAVADGAQPLGVGDTVDGQADPSHDNDRFSFCMTAGDWVRFTFDAAKTAQQPLMRITRDGVVVAENRLYFFESDSAVELYAPSAGDYLLDVAAVSALPSSYRFTMERPDASVRVEHKDAFAAVAFDDELWGTYASADDVDTVALPVPDTSGVVTMRMAIPGQFGDGATAFTGVEVVDGDTVVASLDFRNKLALELPVDAGAQLSLRIHPIGDVGALPFYAVEELSFDTAVVTEQNESGNGVVSGAEALELHSNGGERSALVLVQLTRSDVDMFSFQALSGELVRFSCGAEAFGSGTRELEVDLRDVTGALLARAHEDSVDHTSPGGSRTFLDPARAEALASGGTYIGEVRADSFDDKVDSHWALCRASVFARPRG